MQIVVLGRETALCLAEAEAYFGNAKKITPQIAEIDTDKPQDINKLGGAIKLANLNYRDLDNINDVQLKIEEILQGLNTSTKLNFGLSYYGDGNINLSALGLKIKKSLKKLEIKPRLVLPNSTNQLNAASIKHNKLTAGGAELLIIKTGSKYMLATTYGFQDIDSYSKRDYDKPCRDRKVGMLPPKLSQIMINLTKPGAKAMIVDPFVGSGGVLIEAALMGYNCEGSDISQAMTDCANKNIEWFKENFDNLGDMEVTKPQDAVLRQYPNTSYSIVTEGFLGSNFLSKPTIHLVKEQLPELKKLYLDFFENLRNQTNKPNRICVCIPFWLFPDTTIELKIIDDICKLGYTNCEFTSVRQGTLSYHREGQFTGRQINVFETKQEHNNQCHTQKPGAHQGTAEIPNLKG